MNTAPIYINQIQLIHCGKKYRFTHHETSPKLDSLTNWQVTRKFHLLISPNVANNIYRYFNVENYLGEEAVDVVKKKVQKEIKEVIRGRVSGKWRGKKNSSGMSKVSVGIMKAIELFTL